MIPKYLKDPSERFGKRQKIRARLSKRKLYRQRELYSLLHWELGSYLNLRYSDLK